MGEFKFPQHLEEHRDRGSVLHVVHKCGHTGRLSYGERSFAEADRANQEAQLCFECHNAALIASTKNGK